MINRHFSRIFFGIGTLILASILLVQSQESTVEAPPKESTNPVAKAKNPSPVEIVPLSIPPEAKPPIETETVERIGIDGIEAFQRGNFEGAREAYLNVLKVEPNNIPALVNLGAAEFRLGNNNNAERVLQRALQLKPDNPTAWLNLGIIYLDQNDPMRALAAAAQAAIHAPNDPITHNYLGVAAGRNRWFDAAESELRKAIELKPDYADAHFNMAVFCLERMPPATELARRHYNKALKLGAEPDPLIEKALKN